MKEQNILIHPPQIERFVFSGGGEKGLVYGEALLLLSELVDLTQIKDVAGASAGAMTALVVALGADFETICEIVSQSKLKLIPNTDHNQAVMQSLIENVIENLVQERIKEAFHLSVNATHLFETEKSELLEKITVFQETREAGKLTFSQLSKLNELFTALGEPNKIKSFYTLGVDKDSGAPVYFSLKKTPNFDVGQAALISASFPRVFSPVESDVNGKVMTLIDGGVYSNTPFEAIDQYGMISDAEKHATTLGFILSEKPEMGLDQLHGGQKEMVDIAKSFENAAKKIACFGHDVISNLDRNGSHVRKFGHNVINLQVNPLDTFVFDVDEKVGLACERARDSVREFITLREEQGFSVYGDFITCLLSVPFLQIQEAQNAFLKALQTRSSEEGKVNEYSTMELMEYETIGQQIEVFRQSQIELSKALDASIKDEVENNGSSLELLTELLDQYCGLEISENNLGLSLKESHRAIMFEQLINDKGALFSSLFHTLSDNQIVIENENLYALYQTVALNEIKNQVVEVLRKELLRPQSKEPERFKLLLSKMLEMENGFYDSPDELQSALLGISQQLNASWHWDRSDAFQAKLQFFRFDPDVPVSESSENICEALKPLIEALDKVREPMVSEKLSPQQ